MKPHLTWIAMIGLVVWAAPAPAQDGLDDMIDLTEPAATTEDIPGAMTAEEIVELLKQARPLLLGRERIAVAQEIEDGLSFNPDKIDQALDDLEADPKNTIDDNIARIIAAFAAVDDRLAEPAGAFLRGEYAEAAPAIQAIINPNGTGYIDAAKRMMVADSLLAMKRYEDAVDVYREILKTTPDKVSIACAAALKAGQTYEKMNRKLYTKAFYKWWLDNYGFLDPEKAIELQAKLAQIEKDYNDPLGTLATKMGEVKELLAGAESGKPTQVKQKEIVDMLDDLIATAEESRQSSSQSESDKKKQPSQGEGQDQKQGKNGQQASSNNPPSSPAEQSVLPTGAAPKPEGLSAIRPSDGTDAWGALPPVEREKIVEMFKQAYSVEDQERTKDYFTGLAEESR